MPKIQPGFIKKVSTIDKLSQEIFSVNMDVRSLNTNIPNNEGFKAVETTLSKKIIK